MPTIEFKNVENSVLAAKNFWISDLLIFFVFFSGEDLELECITTGANPPAKLRWFLGEQVPNWPDKRDKSSLYLLKKYYYRFIRSTRLFMNLILDCSYSLAIKCMVLPSTILHCNIIVDTSELRNLEL
jgi:hypothetical protein